MKQLNVALIELSAFGVLFITFVTLVLRLTRLCRGFLGEEETYKLPLVTVTHS
jgi:hypothetical protein